MKKKDYELIAQVMKATKPLNTPSAEMYQWNTTLGLLMDSLEQENPRFDREKFIKICEGIKAV